MEWTDKVLLVQALNQGEYETAVNIIKEYEADIDNQAMSMFVIGFSLTRCDLLTPIAHIIHKFENICLNDFRANTRLLFMLDQLKNTER